MNILFLIDKKNKKELENASFLKDLLTNYNVSVLPVFLARKNLAGSIKSILQIRKWTKENDIHLIHCFNDYLGKLAFLGFQRKKIVVSLFENDINKKNLSSLSPHISKLFSPLLYKNAIIESKEHVKILPKKGNYFLLPKKISDNEFLPLDKNFNRDNLNLNVSETYILYIDNIEGRTENYLIVKNAVSRLDNQKINLVNFNYDLSHIKNQIFNSADIIISSLSARSINKITEEILLTNNRLISLENNMLLDDYAQIENLHFCDKQERDIEEKIKFLLISQKKDSREEIIKVNRRQIFDRLIYLYKMDYIWKS